MEDLDRRAGIKKMSKILTMSKQRRKSQKIEGIEVKLYTNRKARRER